jgi:hypothetical protein
MPAPGIGQKIAKQHGITFAGFCRALLHVIIFVVVPSDHWHDVATNQQQQKVIVQLQVID